MPPCPRLDPGGPQAVRGQNSTVWGFREADNACFLEARRGLAALQPRCSRSLLRPFGTE